MVVNAVVVTEYDDEEYESLKLKVDVADSVATIFESFGIRHNPKTDRHVGRMVKSELEKITRSWSSSEFGSVVYWMGHGQGQPPRLLDSQSKTGRPNDGIGSQDLVDDLHRIGQNSEFLIVIFEACRSEEFIESLRSELRMRQNYSYPTLFLYSSETVTTPHRVLTELRHILDNAFGLNKEIHLSRILEEFLRSKNKVTANFLHIQEEALRRAEPVSTGQTLDVHRRLRSVLRTLKEEERKHFVAKAQSTDSGELTWRFEDFIAQSANAGEITWNFEGREQERKTVLTWLEDDSSPLCLVRGDAGQGKSAFLGDIVTRCNPDLADALIQVGLITPIDSWHKVGYTFRPISINASGITTKQLIERALHYLGKPHQMSSDIDQPLALIEKAVASLAHRVVFIIDGVDEMQDPVAGARFIGALSSRRMIKVLVASRDAPNEGQQFFAFANAGLVQSILETAPVGQAREIVLRPDHEAIERYIHRRLRHQLPEQELPERLNLPIQDFLHASVLVHEITFDPEWLNEQELLLELVNAGLPELYTLMYDRLAKKNPAFIPLFHACALSQGRGVPIVEDVWLTIAREINYGNFSITAQTLEEFLNSAEQYLRIDIEHDQTVYRPNHSLLRSFLLSKLPDVSSYHRHLALACASQVAGGSSNAYYRHAATMHARRSGEHSWWDIDKLIKPPVWNLLDHRRVVEDAMRTLFGRTDMPSGVEELVLSHHFTTHLSEGAHVEGWQQALRKGIYRGSNTSSPGKSASLRWAVNVIRQPVSLSLPGHYGRVTAIREALLGPAESGLLVGTARGEIRLWSLASGGIVTIFDGLTGGIFALASVGDEKDGLLVIAGDVTGQVATWSVRSRRQLWASSLNIHIEKNRRQEERTGPVLGIAPVNLQGVTQAAIVVTRDHLFLLKLVDGSLITTERVESRTFGSSVTYFLSEEGVPMVLVSTVDTPGVAVYEVVRVAERWTLKQRDFVTLPSKLVALKHMKATIDTFQLLLSDGQVLKWFPGGYPRRILLPAHGALTLGDVSGSPRDLIDVGIDEMSSSLQMRIIDAAGQHQIIASHGGEPTVIQVIDGPGKHVLTAADGLDKRALAASGGADRTVRVWDPYSSGSKEQHNTSPVREVLALPAAEGKLLGVAVTQDDNIRFFNGSNAKPIKSWQLQANFTGLASSKVGSGRALIAVGTSGGHVNLWKQNSLDIPQKSVLPGNFGSQLVVDVDPSGSLVATASPDGLITVWNLTHEFNLMFEKNLTVSHLKGVKVFRPFEDLVVVFVLTLTGVHYLEYSWERSRWIMRDRYVRHRLPKSQTFSLYTAGRQIGLLSGAVDGQVHSIPRLWTPASKISAEDRVALGSINLKQPVASIATHRSKNGTAIVAAGAYGKILRTSLNKHLSPRNLNLEQHIASVSVWNQQHLLIAVQGGVVFLDFGDNE